MESEKAGHTPAVGEGQGKGGDAQPDYVCGVQIIWR
jgi:hypothetical protein